jgi:hypothetical protein
MIIMKTVIYDMAQLEDRLRYWQGRLGLLDWTIVIMFDRGFNLGDAAARINVYEDKRLARIRIMEPGDYDPTNVLPYNMEQTLVHELLHIHFWPLTRDIAGNVLAEEQAIEAISWALIGLERRAEEMESYYLDKLHQQPPLMLPGLMHVRYASDQAGG